MTKASGAILVTGWWGQVGSALLKALNGFGPLIAADLQPGQGGLSTLRIDLADKASIQRLLREVRPSVIINPAAYTAVDKAESERELAFRINAEALEVIGEEAKALGAAVIHYSTDYVFDGSGSEARNETAETAPLSVYGESKLQGEHALRASGCPAIILRTSWVFSASGHNFVKTMLRLGAEREELRVVDDQIGAPTSASFLAKMTRKILESGPTPRQAIEDASGLYHLTCAGETSWCNFARTIFQGARARGKELAVKNVVAIPTSDYPTPAKRPLNSRLDCSKFHARFGTTPLPWQAALDQVLDELLGPAAR